MYGGYDSDQFEELLETVNRHPASLAKPLWLQLAQTAEDHQAKQEYNNDVENANHPSPLYFVSVPYFEDGAWKIDCIYGGHIFGETTQYGEIVNDEFMQCYSKDVIRLCEQHNLLDDSEFSVFLRRFFQELMPELPIGTLCQVYEDEKREYVSIVGFNLANVSVFSWEDAREKDLYTVRFLTENGTANTMMDNIVTSFFDLHVLFDHPDQLPAVQENTGLRLAYLQNEHRLLTQRFDAVKKERDEFRKILLDSAESHFTDLGTAVRRKLVRVRKLTCQHIVSIHMSSELMGVWLEKKLKRERVKFKLNDDRTYLTAKIKKQEKLFCLVDEGKLSYVSRRTKVIRKVLCNKRCPAVLEYSSAPSSRTLVLKFWVQEVSKKGVSFH